MQVTVIEIDIDGDEIEVEYSDGSEEEIKNGVYERKNSNDVTVEERPAVAADAARLLALSVGDTVTLPSGDGTGDDNTGGDDSGSGDDDGTPDQGPGDAPGTPGGGDDAPGTSPPDPATITKVEIFGDNIEIEYADGSKEQIEFGIYERKDASGETVEERPATADDRARLEALAAGVDPALVEQEFILDDGTIVETGPNQIEVTLPDGSKKEIEFGIYEEKNPAGITIVERPATEADIAELLAFLPAGVEAPDLTPGAPAPGGGDDGTPDQGPGDAPGTPGGGDGPPSTPLPDPSTITSAEVFGDTIEIEYADGSKEEIEFGIYERKNAAGVTLEERPATAEDRARLEALAAGADPNTLEQEFTLADGTMIEIGPNKLEVTFPDGSKTEIELGIFEEKDPAGNTIVERPATETDIAQLTALLPSGVEAPDLTPGAPAPGGGDDDGTPDQGPGDAPGTPGAGDGGAPGNDDGTPDQGSSDGLLIAQNVTLFYTETLGRAPEKEGLNFWIDAVENGLELDDLAEAFIDSFEFAAAVGDPDDMDDGEFVETLYEDLLERVGDDAGKAFWTAFLEGGGTRPDLVIAFVISDENRENTPELDDLVEMSPGEWDILS